MKKESKVDVLLGLQWGDEGKGKAIDVLTPIYDIVARFQGGPNAGHTLEFDDIKVVLHQVPSGIFHSNIINVIGNGVVFDPVKFHNEILGSKDIPGLVNYIPFEDIKKKLIISDEAHLILPSHRWLDEVYEISKGSNKIGSTKCGIGPCYTDKTARVGIRIGEIKKPGFKQRFENLLLNHKDIINIYNDLFFDDNEDWEREIEIFFEAIEFLQQFSIQDTPAYLNQALRNNQRILAEGAQGTSLDINFGDYPFVTSSTTVSAGACIGLGIPPQAIGEVFGLVKAYSTRVGSGPFPTEQDNETGERLRQKGNEYGATTGRPRRCGWLDLVQIKRAVMLNGVTKLILSKADVLTGFGEINICVKYDKEDNPIYRKFSSWNLIANDIDFSESFSVYKKFIENETKTPITIVSTGPDRKDILIKRF